MKSLPKRVSRISIIGLSRAGSSIASAVRVNKDAAFVLHSHISARALIGLQGDDKRIAARRTLKREGGPNVLLVATNDDSITTTAREALRVAGDSVRLVVQLAGSRSSTLLPAGQGVARLTLHPIQTFPRADASQLAAITWAAAGEDSEAIGWGKRFVKSLGGRQTIVLKNEQLPLYHAMLSLGANGIAILLATVEEMMRELQLDERTMKRAIRPLLERSLANALNQPAQDALTGPIARGDRKTIQSHKKAIAALRQPLLAQLYETLERSAKSLTPSRSSSSNNDKLLRKR